MGHDNVKGEHVRIDVMVRIKMMTDNYFQFELR
jgi:hypothetical protein